MQLLTLFIICFWYLFGCEPKFLNYQTQFVVVEEVDGKIMFHDPILEELMIETGVAIPKAYRSEFENRERVFPHEKDFLKAFQKFYTPFVYSHKDYVWIES
jgi:hypothetical protein